MSLRIVIFESKLERYDFSGRRACRGMVEHGRKKSKYFGLK